MTSPEKIDIGSLAGAALVYKDVASLDVVQEQIRILHLEPGWGSTPISCSIHLISLTSDPPPKYEALSYTWGDPKVTREIIVNGYLVNVTFNLYSALYRLRQPEEMRVLWVDALCINQTDVDERGQQTVQECILPQRATFIYGPVSIELAFMLQAFSALSRHMLADCCSTTGARTNPELMPHLRKLGLAMRPIDQLRSERREGPELSLWTALGVTRSRFATDDRDRVFGVLGLVDSWMKDPIVPNYRAKTEEIYTLATLDEVLATNSLLTLHLPLQKDVYPGVPSNPSRPYKTGEPYFDAFWKCLCWDLVLSVDGPAEKAHFRRSKGTTDSYEAFVAFAPVSPYSVFHPEGLSPDDREAAVHFDPRFDIRQYAEPREHTSEAFITEQLIGGITLNTTMFMTESGYLGLGPAETQVGDEVWCLFGSWMPFVLRPTGKTREVVAGEREKPLYSVLGICYVHGAMDGEAADDENLPIQTVYLA
ncbi:heterokaryon incompatibility protein-domain-containing protein [Fusarium solani]|uniref:Heterokaryon incompatibility protein-domain-containing protein n=1 Tax=Fusarium solani TaxID=169388 RepID=A0A9P9GWJ6_FUSSL|nr:heterokaryon incompatibility protein-domain-containing protein [Fusarium solani]KAH7246888.1 heterokaryon incompatibility protein-domain-containing protein [Fusarium solani]